MNLFSWIIRPLPLIALVIAVLGGLAAPASADLVLSIGPALPPIAQPTGGATHEITMTVFARANTSTQPVLGYTLPIDISPPMAKGLPLGMTITGATARTSFGGVFKTELNPDAGDLLVSAGFPGGTAVLFETTPRALFDFNVSIDSTIATGDYTVDFISGSLFSVDRDVTTTFDPAAVIRIVAVPEPSTLSVLGLLVVPTVLRRRRRSI